jgi:hypothetical protein
MFTLDYKRLLEKIDALHRSGWTVEGIELDPFAAMLLSGQTKLLLTEADPDSPAEPLPWDLFEFPVFLNPALPFGKFKIRTAQPYQPTLSEDFHK